MKYPFIKKGYQGREPFLDQPSTILQSLSYPCHPVLCWPCHVQLAFTVLLPLTTRHAWPGSMWGSFWLQQAFLPTLLVIWRMAWTALGKGLSQPAAASHRADLISSGRWWRWMWQRNLANLALEMALGWSRGQHSPVVLAGCHFQRPQATTSIPALLLLPISFVVQESQKGRDSPAVINAGRVLPSNWILIA